MAEITLQGPVSVFGTIDEVEQNLSGNASVTINFDISEGISFVVDLDVESSQEEPTNDFTLVAAQGSSGRVGHKDNTFGSLDPLVLSDDVEIEGLYTVASSAAIRFEVKGEVASDYFDTLNITGIFSDSTTEKTFNASSAVFTIDPGISTRWEWSGQNGLMVPDNTYQFTVEYVTE